VQQAKLFYKKAAGAYRDSAYVNMKYRYAGLYPFLRQYLFKDDKCNFCKPPNFNSARRTKLQKRSKNLHARIEEFQQINQSTSANTLNDDDDVDDDDDDQVANDGVKVADVKVLEDVEMANVNDAAKCSDDNIPSKINLQPVITHINYRDDNGNVCQNLPALMLFPRAVDYGSSGETPSPSTHHQEPLFQGVFSVSEIEYAISNLDSYLKQLKEPDENFGKLPENYRAGDNI